VWFSGDRIVLVTTTANQVYCRNRLLGWVVAAVVCCLLLLFSFCCLAGLLAVTEQV